jgi:hypothetical protein
LRKIAPPTREAAKRAKNSIAALFVIERLDETNDQQAFDAMARDMFSFSANLRCHKSVISA